MSETWISTPSGGFNPLAPSPGAISPRDLALGQAGLFRYGRMAPSRPTVAQHAVECSEEAEVLGYGFDAMCWALLHDAAEAYLGDVPGPIRRGLGWLHGTRFISFADVEARILRAVAARFGLPWPILPSVLRLDLAHRAAEVRDLCRPGGLCNGVTDADWGIAGVEPFPGPLPRRWTPAEAEAAWLARFERLFGPIH